jgi:hypothetical protein
MTGSTILMTKEPQQLVAIDSVDSLDDFVCLELTRMITIDFEILASSGGVRWAESPPILYLPDDGMAIFKINESGLSYILKLAVDRTSEHRVDLTALAMFADLHGATDLYEVATF